MSTVTRANLAEMIYTQVGLSRNESAELLESVLERLASALQSGDSVKISGCNPKTGVEVPILPRSVLVFRPSQVLKARVNGQEPDAAAAEDDGG